MEHSNDFLRDEVRNGFYIPTAIKQGWAAELDVLAEIDRICGKYGIKYFADWGTFLGAVRHGGFVPWDDDLDICMLRDDYTRFREVADAELPKGYVFHDFERKQDHWLFLSRVVINSKMCFEEKYLEEHNNFPWMAGVDIFVKDYLFEDEKKEIRRDKDIMNLIAVADGIVNGDISKQAIASKINEIRKKFLVKLPGKYREHDMAVALYKLAEQQMSKVEPDSAGRVGQIFPWVLKHGPRVGEPKSTYDKLIRLPFEDTTIPVPAAYNIVLESRYRNFNELRKVWDGHDYPFFEGQKRVLEELSGEKFPEFTFDKGMLNRRPRETANSLRQTSGECMAELRMLLENARKALAGKAFDEFTQAVSDSQQLAADFGTLIEQVKGEDRESTRTVINALQEYCDELWLEYQEVSGGTISGNLEGSSASLDKVAESVRANISDRMEILFLPVGVKEWKAMEYYYSQAIRDGNADVYVVPLPLLKKDYFGVIHMTDEEILTAAYTEAYPAGIVCEDWNKYDISIHCPDTVYFQNPYDSCNLCLTVPPEYYAENLQMYTENLICIPIACTADFGAEDIIDIHNLKYYVTTPGLMYADKAIVRSESIKEQYIEALKAFAGDDTADIWQKKIAVDDQWVEHVNMSGNKKRILYLLGANELIEHGNTLAASVKDRLGRLTEYGDQVSVEVVLYPYDRSQWDNLDKELSREIYELVDSCASAGKITVIGPVSSDADEFARSYDAYYGGPSPFIPAFILQEKPVMLADYSISCK